MSKYLAFAQSALQTQLAYRGQVWAAWFGRLIQVFAWIAIWMAVYKDAGSVNGVTLPEMITYAVIGSTLITAWDWRKLIYTLGNSVTSGDVAIYLLKPLRFPLYLFATECGNLTYRIAAIAVPVIIVATLTYGVLPPASLFHGLMFLAFFALSFVLMFLMAALCGLLAFWLMTAFSLEWTLQGILSLLSGSAIPLWFFPDAAQGLIKLLPSAWIGYHPIAVYLGKTTVSETWFYFTLGLGWAGLMAGGVALLWRAAATRITVQGG
ncbi:ABC-2 family transporter protein [Devosia sp.]|uniref:ABC transporter permease n=1 Tax=Devosia sp. TaxID=1871048 RepID=UPI00326578A8